jgi:hypothetical protein
METFWATAKSEIDHIWGPVRNFTRSELRTILFDYIEVFYNRQRHQRALNHRTPSTARRARFRAAARRLKSASTLGLPRTRARRPPCLRRMR